MRTVALAPGRTGGLAGVVPAIAPSRRALSAMTQLRGEARWADVVVLHSARAVPPFARAMRSGPPLVLVLDDGDAAPTSRSVDALRRAGVLRVLAPSERPGGAAGWADLLTGAAR